MDEYEASAPEPSKETHRPCPFCAEPIQRAAVHCRFCKNNVGGEEAPLVSGKSDAPGKRRLSLIFGGAALLLAILAGGTFALLQGGDDTSTPTLDGANRDVIPPEVVEAIFVKQVNDNVPQFRTLPRENTITLGKAVCRSVKMGGKDIAALAIYTNSPVSEVGAANFVAISVIAFCPELESEL